MIIGWLVASGDVAAVLKGYSAVPASGCAEGFWAQARRKMEKKRERSGREREWRERGG